MCIHLMKGLPRESTQGVRGGEGASKAAEDCARDPDNAPGSTDARPHIEQPPADLPHAEANVTQ